MIQIYAVATDSKPTHFMYVRGNVLFYRYHQCFIWVKNNLDPMRSWQASSMVESVFKAAINKGQIRPISEYEG